MSTYDNVSKSKLIDRRSAAERLCVSIRHFDRLVINPDSKIEKIRVGKRAVRFLPEDIDNFIKNHGLSGAP